VSRRGPGAGRPDGVPVPVAGPGPRDVSRPEGVRLPSPATLSVGFLLLCLWPAAPGGLDGRAAPGAESPSGRRGAPAPADPARAAVREDPASGRAGMARIARELADRGFPADTDSVRGGADTLPADTVETAPADTAEEIVAPADTVGRDTTDREAVRDTLEREGPAVRDTTFPDVGKLREEMAGGDFPDRDDLFRRLAEQGEGRAVEYRGHRVQVEVRERVFRLADSAQTNYGEAALRADSIVYRAPLQFISARGRIHLVSPDRREMSSDSVLYYDVSRLKGTVVDARTHFAERGSTWYVRGDAIPVGQRELYVNRGSFTSCNLEEPHYRFKAGQIKMVSQDVIVAWPVVVYVANIPVFWLPFFAQDIRPDRRSGFLPPRFGFNDVVQTDDDVGRQVQDFGYYLAINEFMDAQTTVDWFSGNFVRLNNAFRYRVLKDFIQGNVNVSREWGDRGNNVTFDFNHRQELTPDTDIRASGRFVQETRLFQDRAFDPEEQERTIDSDFGLNHRFPFADLSLSARRRQFLRENDATDLTLPSLNLNFSPVTLFEAPRNRAGLFNNLTWSGSSNFSRQDNSRDAAPDLVTTRGNFNQSMRLGELSVGSGVNVINRLDTPVERLIAPIQIDPTTGDTAAADTTFRDLASSTQTTGSWNVDADYQIDLMGSTTLSPTIRVDGGFFRSDFPGDSIQDTGGSFVSTPTRVDFGVNLRTDIFGFLPGFGPFSRVRHKFSPSIDWSYSPAARADSALRELRGFPGGGGEAENTLTLNFNQTLEAKVRSRPARRREPAAERARAADETVGPAGPEREAADDTLPGEGAARGEREPGPGADGAEPGDGEAGPGAEEVAPDGAGVAPGGEGRAVDDGALRTTAPAARRPERTITLLSIRSDPLRFDFEREDEPVLVTDRWGNSLTSDLLRGMSVNIETDLFEGTGVDRNFSPFLSSVNASFSFRSGASIGDFVGLQRGPSEPRRREREESPIDSRGRLSTFEESGDDDLGEAGPWNLNLAYSLRRRREDEGVGGGESQTLSGSLRLNPTPNWRMSWRTSFNFEEEEFGRQLITLDRELHQWRASFVFAKSPNGNFVFQFRINLTDAPELRFDYDQRSDPPR